MEKMRLEHEEQFKEFEKIEAQASGTSTTTPIVNN